MVIVAPVLLTTYLGDDIWNSSVDGALANAHETFWGWIAANNARWIRCCGRLTVLNMIEGYGIFHVIHSLMLYKLAQAASLAVNLTTFYVLLRALRLSIGTSLLGVLAAVATFQFRVYSDAILGFALGYPTILEANLLSFLFFARYCGSGARRDLWPSIAFWLLALSLYETSYPLSLIHLFIALRMRPRTALRAAAPFLALSAAFVALELGVRHFIHMRADAVYRLNLDPSTYFTTLAQQVTGAIPLTYRLFHEAELLAWGEAPGAPWFLLAAAFVTTFAAVVTILVNRRSEILAEDRLWALGGAGLALWILPAVLVSAVPRYQHESSWGLAYLPVYMSGFGVALTACAGVALMRWLGGATARRWRIVAAATALLFAAVLTLTYATNARVVDIYASERNGRALVYAAIDHGLLDRLAPRDRLFVNSLTLELRSPAVFNDPAGSVISFVDPSNFFRAHLGERLFVYPIDSIAQRLCGGPACAVATRNAYAMAALALDARAGYAILGRVTGVRTVMAGRPGDALVVEPRLLLTGPDLAQPAADAYAVQWEGVGCGARGSVLHESKPLEALHLLTSGPEWRIVALRSPCKTIDLATVTIYSSR